MRIVVTGGAGFIGSALVRHLIGRTDHDVLVIDKLTYAGNLSSLESVQGHRRYSFSQTDICDPALIADLFAALHGGACNASDTALILKYFPRTAQAIKDELAKLT